MAALGCAIEAQRADAVVVIGQRGRVLEIPAGTERPTLAPEHCDRGIVVGVECRERFEQLTSTLRVHCIACFVARMDDGPDRSILFNTHGHRRSPFVGGALPASVRILAQQRLG